jgi:multicomponent Na+:H+ antiporter subunit D
MIGELLLAVNAPAILLVILILAAAVTYVLRDWERITALSAAVITGIFALLLWRLDVAQIATGGSELPSLLSTSQTVQRFGFTLQLHDTALPAMVLVFLIATVALLLATRFPQGSSFVPMTLTLLAGYTTWYLLTVAPVDVTLLLPLGLIILSALSAVALQAGRPVHAAGPLRWMVAPVLAFPLFLVARYYLQLGALTPDDIAPLRTAAALLTFGLLLLMAPVPLHSVAPATAESAPPLATALFTLLYQLALVFLISQVVIQYPFMETLAPLNIWFAWAGLVTAIWAGVAAIGASQPGRLWGYLALHDWGIIILLLSVPGIRTWSLVAFLFVLRSVSMLTAATGLTALEYYVGSVESEDLQGAGVRLPWNSAAYLMGGLGLVGFPLSAGFSGHWAALQIIAASDWRSAVAVLLASSAAVFALIRMARILYGPLANRYLQNEQTFSVVMAVGVLLLSVGLAVAPQLLNVPVSRAILAFGS